MTAKKDHTDTEDTATESTVTPESLIDLKGDLNTLAGQVRACQAAEEKALKELLKAAETIVADKGSPLPHALKIKMIHEALHGQTTAITDAAKALKAAADVLHKAIAT